MSSRKFFVNLAGGPIYKTLKTANLFPPAESFRENRPSAAGADVLDPATPGPLAGRCHRPG